MALKQFPRRPETISAMQFAGSIKEVLSSVKSPDRVQINEKTSKVEVLTNHGWVVVELGDWIIQRADGEIYPCKNELFQTIADTECIIPEFLPEHMKRVFVEKYQLGLLLDGLSKYIDAGQPKASKEEAAMQRRQYDIMRDYQIELHDRLALYKQL